MEINKANFEKVVADAKAKTNDAKWQRAIDKAAKGILDGSLIVTVLAHGALVTSNNGSYRANGKCSCLAAQHGDSKCYHRAAARLMERYEETAPAVSREEIIAEIKTSWSAKFPTASLADELMARFRRNRLEMLSIDFLTAIRAAIA